jgi:4-hydroxy-4-methyl-2-oxoglutarate aldolase
MERENMDELIRRIRTLHTALVCDAMDRLGIPCRSMDFRIQPIYPNAIVAGRALTLLEMPVYRRPAEPYKVLFDAFDHIEAGTVLIVSSSGEYSSGIWGELVSIGARALGAEGAVIDGLTRDVAGIAAMQFPVFARGLTPLDSEGRCEAIEWGTPVKCGGVIIKQGDVIFGDTMGVVAIPPERLVEVLACAEKKEAGEQVVRDHLQCGEHLREIFSQFHIL